MPASLTRLTEMALVVLALVLAGTVMLIILTILLRQQRERYYRRVKRLFRQYQPVLAKLLAGKHSAHALAALQLLPLGDRELLCEPFLARGGMKPSQLPTLRALCEELGLIAMWQRRLKGDAKPGTSSRRSPTGRGFTTVSRAWTSCFAPAAQGTWGPSATSPVGSSWSKP